MSNFSEFSLEQTRTRNHTRNILKNVYLWMALALTITGVVAWGVGNNPSMIRGLASGGMFIIIPFATLALVWGLSAAINRLSPLVASLLFALYAVLVGVSISGIFVIFELSSIYQAFFGAAATFAVMSIYGLVTKRDLTAMGTFLHMALIGLVIANLITFFIGGLNGPMNYVVSSIGVLIFVGLTAYDTQKIKNMSEALGDQINEGDYVRLSISGALTLYLDFINIFLYILRIFGNRR